LLILTLGALETYAIKGEKNCEKSTFNGPQQLEKFKKDDIIINTSYATLEFEEAKTFKPWIIFLMKMTIR
jgi:aspartate 1-decarboxylase